MKRPFNFERPLLCFILGVFLAPFGWFTPTYLVESTRIGGLHANSESAHLCHIGSIAMKRRQTQERDPHAVGEERDALIPASISSQAPLPR